MSVLANSIDAHVGIRMRQRREAMGISQGRVGRHLGLTFSQIQKYEKGSNRIGAGRLYQIASFLGVKPSYFFAGLDDDDVPALAQYSEGEMRDEVRALIEAYSSIPDPETRNSVLALVRSLNSGLRAQAPGTGA